ncbi:MAG: anti-sigma factor family protein [Pyrinomonadaceae bacterium]
MICEKCQGFSDELICDYVDGSLSKEEQASLEESLRRCSSCSQAVSELQTIFRLSSGLSEAPEIEATFDSPPNSEALWRRIVNTLEIEGDVMEDGVKAKGARGARGATSVESSSTGFVGWIKGMRDKRWELSFPQLVAVIAVITISVSAITTLSLQRLNYYDQTTISDNTSSSTDNDRASNIDDVMRQQQQALDYWTQRVDQRKSRWNPQMREAFNRNMGVVDQAVNDSLFELRRNPRDNVSQEMLNAALKDKMEMLKEFSDL